MKLIPMGNTHGTYSEGGGKTHVGDDDVSGKTLCGIDAFYFHGPDDGIDLMWIKTGGSELCKKCAKIATGLLEEEVEEDGQGD
jgi:hypothetical protein